MASHLPRSPSEALVSPIDDVAIGGDHELYSIARGMVDNITDIFSHAPIRFRADVDALPCCLPLVFQLGQFLNLLLGGENRL